LLRQLQETQGTSLQVVGSCPYQADFATAMGKLLPDLLDLIVVREPAWPAHADTQAILTLGAGFVVAANPEKLERFRGLAEQFPLSFLRETPDLLELRLALVSALAARRRHVQAKSQVARLQQRLDDRIIVERAKGILVQRLKISEEEAYQRLRVQSRRQRRQIRDIAQSLLDTQTLMEPAPAENDTMPTGVTKGPGSSEEVSPSA
jgi:response regulator NasT